MVCKQSLRICMIAALIVWLTGCGTTTNYRTRTGTVEGTTRAIEGTTK
jgi:hypothetical protein